MRIKLAIPDRLVTPEALEAALEATALASEQAIARGEVPPITEAIKRGVRWREEPFTDGEHFDLPAQVLGRGWGDCDDLAPWLAGELRATGADPGAVPRVYETRPGRWHVVVQTSDGEIHDPSRWAGMGKRSSVSGAGGVCGARAKPFARPGDGGIAVMPRNGRFYARCDVPLADSFAHLASISRSRDPDVAIDRAIAGAIACGEALGVDCSRAVRAGTLLIGDDDELDAVGFLPAAAALAPAGLSVVKSLFGGKKDDPEKALRRALKGMGLSEADAKEQVNRMFHGGRPKEEGGKTTPEALRSLPGPGAVSLPLEAAAPQGSNQHMMLTYYPAHAQGPVVMRF